MANFYTQYSSFVAENLTSEEKVWCERALKLAERHYDSRGEIMPSITIDRDAIWVHDDDGGDIEEAVRLVQMFFGRWRPQAVASIEFAHTCDKPRVGAFGGGAVVFTAKTEEWINTDRWAAELMGELQEELQAA
ncbi:MAG: hypothetical protein ABIG63_03035 [Chloroflexota bacterium]